MANRGERARLGKEIVDILKKGSYLASGDSVGVTIKEDLDNCVEKTKLFGPDELASVTEEKVEKLWEKARVAMQIEVVEESTLGAGRRWCSDPAGPRRVGCLNFASAKNPGGGFLGGSRAQEESLAMASGLYWSLTAPQVEEYYAANRVSFFLL